MLIKNAQQRIPLRALSADAAAPDRAAAIASSAGGKGKLFQKRLSGLRLHLGRRRAWCPMNVRTYLDTTMRDFVLVTCEHGGNEIPADHAALFRGWEPVLDSHRGFDRGALMMARDLADAFDAPLVVSTTSRLLIDLNRSLTNPRVWSGASRTLCAADKARIVQAHYAPYRQQAEAWVREGVTAGCRVVHLSSHSFTPVLDGQVRTADAGLLYDPARAGEVELAARWKAALVERHPVLRVRRNYPYAGKNDGLTASLRRRYPADRYVGIELELNQALVVEGAQRWQDIRTLMVASLQAALH